MPLAEALGEQAAKGLAADLPRARGVRKTPVRTRRTLTQSGRGGAVWSASWKLTLRERQRETCILDYEGPPGERILHDLVVTTG